MSDKTNINSNESILQKKPAESAFHVHARTSKFRVYFFKPFKADFINFCVKKKSR